MNTRPLASIGVAFLAAFASKAPAEPWDWEALAAVAVANYPSIQASLAEQHAAQSDLDSARWQRFPTPSVQASRTDDGDDQVVIQVQQPLWTGGRITAGINAGEARLAAAGGGVGEAEQEVLLRVAETYVDAVRAQAQQQVSTENVRQHEQLRDLIARRVAQQISPEVDLSLAESRLAQAQTDLSSITQQLDIALEELGELVGQPVESIDPVVDWEAALPGLESEAQAEASRYSPLLFRLAEERRAAGADVRSERARLFPVIALRLEHERGDGTLDDSESRALIVLESEFDAGLSTLSATNAAVSRREALARQREAAERQLRTEVASAWRQWRAAQMRLDSAQRQRDSTQEVFESYTRQYVIGQKSWLDVLNAVREATDAALSVETARAEMREPMLRIALLTGRLGELASATVYDPPAGEHP